MIYLGITFDCWRQSQVLINRPRIWFLLLTDWIICTFSVKYFIKCLDGSVLTFCHLSLFEETAVDIFIPFLVFISFLVLYFHSVSSNSCGPLSHRRWRQPMWGCRCPRPRRVWRPPSPAACRTCRASRPSSGRAGAPSPPTSVSSSTWPSTASYSTSLCFCSTRWETFCMSYLYHIYIYTYIPTRCCTCWCSSFIVKGKSQ